MIDDSVKQKLLDSLAKEPPMVISTAYAYAKNYVLYGEDITKAWTTAVQQVSVIQEVRQKAWVEAYDSFKKDYENRLKADMVAMLEDIKDELKHCEITGLWKANYREGFNDGVSKSLDAIQQTINALKADRSEEDGNDT